MNALNLLFLISCGFGDKASPSAADNKASPSAADDKAPPSAAEAPKSKPPADEWTAKEVKSVRAFVGPANVMVPLDTHWVTPPSVAGDYNIYPADNGILLQGIASGSIGNHEAASFWVTGVHDSSVENGPSHLEAVLVYAVECDDCPGEETEVVRIDSKRSTADKKSDLLRVKSMKVQDLQKDGNFEVILDARFRPCCDGDEKRPPYSETIVLKIEDQKIERWLEAEHRRRAN